MEKYVVYRKDDMTEVTDAVVIRTQDIFAESALSSYANAVVTAVEIMKAVGFRQNGLAQAGVLAELTEIADYFMDKAAEAHEGKRRLPDL